MGSDVLVNGMEPCCIASDGKCIAAMPDVCFTPPQAPPTPPGVPIPYPNNGMASDLTDGTTSVQICGKPVAMKDKSSFKKTAGDEAGNAGTKGVVSASNRGALFFAAWSMDVKFEGENVVRHLDIGTANHASQVGNAPPWPFLATMKPPTLVDDARCKLQPYSKKCPDKDGKPQTPHHCVPDHCFRAKADGAYYQGGVPHQEGLCICVEGATKSTSEAENRIRKGTKSHKQHYAMLAEHGRIHKLFDYLERELGLEGKAQGHGPSARLGDLEEKAAHSIAKVTGCDPANLQQQLRDYHGNRQPPLGPDTRLRADPSGRRTAPSFEEMGTVMEVGED